MAISLQVVGFPLKVYRRLVDLKPTWEGALPAGTSVRYVTSTTAFAPKIEKPQLNQIRVNIQAGYVHIAALPTRDFAALSVFQFDCRLIRLLVDGDLARLDAASLAVALLQAVEYELRWCDAVKPDSPQHPLWLPPPSFEVAAELSRYWNRCDCYRDTSSLTEANNLLQGVAARHRRPQEGVGVRWIDARSRRFTWDRSTHGLTPEERSGDRRFRFAAEVPPGFHYDVVHDDGHRRFSIVSRTGRHDDCFRANVDPWGAVMVRE